IALNYLRKGFCEFRDPENTGGTGEELDNCTLKNFRFPKEICGQVHDLLRRSSAFDLPSGMGKQSHAAGEISDAFPGIRRLIIRVVAAYIVFPKGVRQSGDPVPIDLNTGNLAWQVPYGNGDHIRNHPELIDLDLPPLGGDGRHGPLLTKSLLIVAQSPGGRGSGMPGKLVALDKATGQEVGSVEIPAHPIGTPMTYLVDGKQYVALAIRGNPPEIVSLCLP
ncbi:MAG: hypothetical protein IIB38_15075, partial [Candidatus Hydrogenedentes bacterium]|nr:hypothetical protein [Candidatus Hydrogenedentota bacterium]